MAGEAKRRRQALEAGHPSPAPGKPLWTTVGFLARTDLVEKLHAAFALHEAARHRRGESRITLSDYTLGVCLKGMELQSAVDRVTVGLADDAVGRAIREDADDVALAQIRASLAKEQPVGEQGETKW